jgi:hypothetical protein
MRQLFLIILSTTFLTSCDCYQTVSGTVIDNKTGKPLSNITVYNKEKSWSKTTTDEKGYFKLSNVSGGFSCPPMTVVIDDNNYKKNETSIDAGGQKEIHLEQVDH